MPTSLDNEVTALGREWASAEDDYETIMVAYDEDEPGHDAAPALDIDDTDIYCETEAPRALQHEQDEEMAAIDQALGVPILAIDDFRGITSL